MAQNQDFVDLLDPLDLLVKLDNQVHLALLGPLVTLDHGDLLDLLDHQEYQVYLA